MVTIKELKLNSNGTSVPIECNSINLILGANNTGKSTLLRDVVNVATQHRFEPQNKWLEELTISINNPKDYFTQTVKDIDLNQDFQTTNSKLQRKGVGNVLGLNYEEVVHNTLKQNLPDKIEYIIDKLNNSKEHFHLSRMFTRMSLASEFCDSRLSGPFAAQVNEIDGNIENVIHYLLLNSGIFEKLSETINESFGIKLVFDDLQQGTKHIRLEPSRKITKDEQNDNTSIADYWRSTSPLLQEQGDGLKAYTKIAVSLFIESKNVIFIDEPEAFLHPPQRRNLGKFLAENITRGKQLFIATHDAEFLRGLLTANVDKNRVQLIHLKNEDNHKTFSTLRLKDIESSAEYSEDILNSFFHGITVLCEAEDDRMIYQYAARKYFPQESVDIQFTGHNGKQEVLKVRDILSSRGINVYAIVDVDFLYSDALSAYLKLTEDEKKKMKLCKDLLETKLEKATDVKWKINKKLFKEKGIAYFSTESDKQIIKTAMTILESKKILVVSKGTLESIIGLRKGDKKMVQTAINMINLKEKRNLKVLLSKIIK